MSCFFYGKKRHSTLVLFVCLVKNIISRDSRFEEEGIFNRETGQSFLDNILTRGGSEEPMALFKRFRGREPQLDAMLEHYGIKG